MLTLGEGIVVDPACFQALHLAICSVVCGFYTALFADHVCRTDFKKSLAMLLWVTGVLQHFTAYCFTYVIL